MHIPGLAPDIYSFMNFVITVFFMTLGFIFIMQCQCTDLDDKGKEEDDFFDAECSNYDNLIRYINYHLLDSDTNTDTTDTDRYTDTDTDTDWDYYRPVRVRPTAPPAPVEDFCFVCGDWSTRSCSRCKVARYCSGACEFKHWDEGHRFDCKEYTSPGNIGSTRASSSQGRSSRHRVNGVPTRTTRSSSKRKSGKEHRSVVKCSICHSAIRSYDISQTCAICNQKYHSRCINEWLLDYKKSTCPCCLSTFKHSGSETGQSSNSRN